MAAEEKTQQATPRKRREAREKGQVANSLDLSRGIGLLAIYLMWRSTGSAVGDRLLSLMRDSLDLQPAENLLPEHAMATYTHLLPVMAAIIGPVMIAALVGAILGTSAQTRMMVSSRPLNPDLNRLNPLNGAKRMVSWRGVVSAAKSVVKVALVLTVALWVLRSRSNDILAMSAMDLSTMIRLMLAIAMEITVKCAAMLLIMGAADYAWEWWDMEKSLRMTHQEVKRESREQDGDPHIRARRRQMQRDMLAQGITPAMEQASVVITNPTRYAVALRYDPTGMAAPRVVAKGQRAIARRIVEMARGWNIPVVQEPPVARSLFAMVPLGGDVPEALYHVVAEILAAVYQRKRERLTRSRLASGGVT